MSTDVPLPLSEKPYLISLHRQIATLPRAPSRLVISWGDVPAMPVLEDALRLTVEPSCINHAEVLGALRFAVACMGIDEIVVIGNARAGSIADPAATPGIQQPARGAAKLAAGLERSLAAFARAKEAVEGAVHVLGGAMLGLEAVSVVGLLWCEAASAFYLYDPERQDFHLLCGQADTAAVWN